MRACLVKEKKHVVVVHKLCNNLCCRPGGILEEALAQLGEGDVVHGIDFIDVALPDPQERVSIAKTGSMVSAFILVQLLWGSAHSGQSHSRGAPDVPV